MSLVHSLYCLPRNLSLNALFELQTPPPSPPPQLWALQKTEEQLSHLPLTTPTALCTLPPCLLEPVNCPRSETSSSAFPWFSSALTKSRSWLLRLLLLSSASPVFLSPDQQRYFLLLETLPSLTYEISLPLGSFPISVAALIQSPLLIFFPYLPKC